MDGTVTTVYKLPYSRRRRQQQRKAVNAELLTIFISILLTKINVIQIERAEIDCVMCTESGLIFNFTFLLCVHALIGLFMPIRSAYVLII